jgi:hypothetical protein
MFPRIYPHLSRFLSLLVLSAISLQVLSAIRISSGTQAKQYAAKAYLGFDRNIYPGDDALSILRKSFAFTGYWLGPPPGETVNTWRGKRNLLQSHGFGFALLYRGRQSNEVTTESAASEKGLQDARAAAASAKADGFRSNVVIFLDLEEGGRLSASYHAYLRAWATELSHLGYRAGVYCSGIPVNEGGGTTIITANDIREHIRANKLSYWVYNDVCPPSPGCALSHAAPAVFAGGLNYATIWQFAQSPRRKEFTAQCAATYHSDDNCYAPGDAARAWFLDMNTAASPDPSGGNKSP